MNDLKGIIEDCNKSDLVSDKVIKKIIEIIGQEKWQELHDENNDVCTTMGELIITLKGIAELEQENKVLAQNLEDTEIVNKALEKENAELQHKIDTLQGFLDHDVEFDNLQKENTELKCECRRCVYSDCPCILSDYGKDRNGICDHFKDVFDENIELKDELKKWKNEWQEQVQKANDEGYARTLQTIQLTKAKDHIKKLLDCLKQDTNDPQTNYYVCQYMDKAEQFLNKNSTYERIQKAKYNYTD